MPEVLAVLFDIGGTLVDPAPPATPVAELEPVFLPGVLRTLRALAPHVRLGAVTDTSVMTEADVRAALGGEVSDLLEAIVTSFDMGAAKPHPKGLRTALGQLGISDPQTAVFVGDTSVDREVAEALGMPFVLVGPGRPLPAALGAHLRERLGAFEAARLLVGPLDAAAAEASGAWQRNLTKPPGSLGRVEELGAQLAAIAGACPPPVPTPAAVAVFAGDHGVLAQGVSPWPQEVTAQMVANFCAEGAAINVLARQVGAAVAVVDVGVATLVPDVPGVLRELPVGHLAQSPVFLDRRVRAGTADVSTGPAMSIAEARRALDVGAVVAADLVGSGAKLLVTGDMGIGNTTPSAALIAAVTGRGAAEVTGRGTGIDDATLARKAEIVAWAVERATAALGGSATSDGVALLAEVGGLEHGALAGFIVGGAAAGVPVVVDGVIALSALLVAEVMVPGVSASVIAGHRSVEPGASAALAHLGLEPVLDLGLRLGEGSGAALALPVIEAAARIMREMATFDSAGVTEK